MHWVKSLHGTFIFHELDKIKTWLSCDVEWLALIKVPGRKVFSILHTISLHNGQYPEMQEFSQYLPFFKSNHIPLPDGGV